MIGRLTLAVGLAVLAVAQADVPAVGQAAPKFEAPSLSGADIQLDASGGKITVLNFWATWCPGCRAELPLLDDFYRKNRSRGIAVVGLSADRAHDREDVRAFTHAVTYPIALLEDAKVNGFGAIRRLPLTLVIGKNGQVAAAFAPGGAELTEAALSAAVEAAGK